MELFTQEFHFIRPWWFIALIPCLLVSLYFHHLKSRAGQWSDYIPTHLASVMIEQGSDVTKNRHALLLIIAWIIMVIALAGPTWQKIELPLFSVNKAQIVVLDMSLSMYATDLKPNRLARTKYKVTDLISGLSEGETGLVAYAGDAFVISPMTSDVANLLNLLPSLNPSIMPALGSRPDLAIEKASELLQQANYSNGDIYLITDDIEASQARSITKFLNGTNYRLNIIAVGSEKGAPVTLPNGQLLKNDSGDIVVPKLPLSSLINLAHSVSGQASLITLDDSDIKALAPDSTELFGHEQQSEQLGDRWHEAGPYLLLILLPAVAFHFRRNLMSIALVGFLGVSTLSPNVSAKPTATDEQQQPIRESTWWDNLWQTKDQQAHNQYQQGAHQQAAKNFDDKRWRATSDYQAGNYQQALTQFEQFNDADGLFNQGNALTQLGQYDQALSRYREAQALSPDDEAISRNIDIVEQLKAQQPPSENQNGQDQQSDDQQSGDDQQDQQDQQNQQGEQQDNQEQQQQNQSANNESQQQPNSESDQQQSQDGQQSSAQDNEQAQQSEQDDSVQQDDKQNQEQTQQQAQKAATLNETFDNENLSKEELARLNQLVKKINDDPSLLLKNKMAVESRKRQRQRVATKESKKW